MVLHAQLEVAPRVRVSMEPSGDAKHFENEFFEGTAFFAHQPPADSRLPFAYSDLLAGRGDPVPKWELQIQARLKVEPVGTLFFGIEFQDMPLRLGLVARTVCSAILNLLSTLARKYGHEFRHSFGDQRGERPMLAFPLDGADRIYVSDTPTQLPIRGSRETGVWRRRESDWAPISKSDLKLNEGCYVTYIFSQSYFSFAEWRATGIPGLGDVDLAKVLGVQPAHIICFDEGGPRREHRQFFHMKLSFMQDAQREDTQRPLLPEKKPSSTEVANTEANFEHLAAIEEVDEEDGQHPGSMREADNIVCTNAAGYDSRTRFKIGALVEVVATGRCGEVVAHDGSDLPYKLEFTDGSLPYTDWFAEAALAIRPQQEKFVNFAEPPRAVPFSISFLRSFATDSFLAVTDGTDSFLAPELCKDNLSCITSDLDSAPRDGFLSKSEGLLREDHVDTVPPLSVPWYFVSTAGSTWWGIQRAGKICWRPHEHMQALCEAVLPEVSSSLKTASLGVLPDDFEYARRILEQTLARAQQIPGMLEEFLHVQVDLEKLLRKSCVAAAPWELAALVEAEGCIIALPMILGEQLLCYHHGRISAVELLGASVQTTRLCGAPALTLSTSQRQFLLVVPDESMVVDWAEEMREAANREPKGLGNASFGGAPLRWNKARNVLNNTCLCLQTPQSALALSADLLRLAIACQGAEDISSRLKLQQMSCALKCADLSCMSPQDVWSFWLNVFHCLLLHARIVLGMPKSWQIPGFFNSSCYVVAGHAFSLTEIEHCILRHQMSAPHIQFGGKYLLRAWKRSGEYLAQRPCLFAPTCPQEAFQCRPDWRLNLVLSSGAIDSLDALPVFTPCSQVEFEELISRAVDRVMLHVGNVSETTIQLPYNLCRYRDDAPPGDAKEPSEVRWARALYPGKKVKASYSNKYDWTNREALLAL